MQTKILSVDVLDDCFSLVDADIRATLQSYNYLKRLLSERLEKQVHTPILVSASVFILFTEHALCIRLG